MKKKKKSPRKKSEATNSLSIMEYIGSLNLNEKNKREKTHEKIENKQKQRC